MEPGEFPYYVPHAFASLDSTEMCARCCWPLCRHPYWEDEVEAAIRAMLDVLRELCVVA